MRSKITLIIFCVVLLLIPILACAVDDNALASTNAVATRVTALEAWRNEANAIIAATKAALDTKANKTDLDALKAVPATAAAQGYTKAEVDAELLKRDTKITALETSLKQWTNPVPGQAPPPAGTFTGQVNYTIVAPSNIPISSNQASYTPIQIKIYNGMSASRWVRPIVTFNVNTTYGGNVVANFTGCTPSIQITGNNVQPVTFAVNFIPSQGACSALQFYATGGGVGGAGTAYAGMWLMGSGTPIDGYIMISNLNTAAGSPAVFWNVVFNGSDTP